MSALFKAGSHLFIDKLISGDISKIGQTQAGKGLAAFSGLMLFVSSVFFLYGIHTWAMTNYSPHAAALTTSGVAFVFSLLGITGYYYIAYFKMTRMKKLKNDLTAQVEEYFEKFNEEFAEPIEENPKAAATIAAAAGYTIGSRIT